MRKIVMSTRTRVTAQCEGLSTLDDSNDRGLEPLRPSQFLVALKTGKVNSARVRREKAWFAIANQAFSIRVVRALKSVDRWRTGWRRRHRGPLFLLEPHGGRDGLGESELKRLIDRADEVDLHPIEHVRLQVLEYVWLILRWQNHLADASSLCAEHFLFDSANP